MNKTKSQHKIERGYIKALKKLTPREIEVLELTGQGYTSKEISAQLTISHRTVEKHRENVKEKINLKGFNCLRIWYRKESTYLK